MTKTRPKRVKYSTCLVTYFDILGFRRLLAEKTPGEISRILRILKQAARHDRDTERDFDRLYESFSDLTLRSINVSSIDYLLVRPPLLFYELESIAQVQIEMLQRERILVRGGISIGSLVKSWGLVFGVGLVRAYELETQAQYPRVIIDDALVGVLQRLSHPADEENGGIWRDRTASLVATEEKHSFVDYLRYALEYFGDFERYLDFLALHKTVVQDGLSQFASEPRIRSKYRWLKRYHNSTIRWMDMPLEMRKSMMV
jgi:hypothetical protein